MVQKAIVESFICMYKIYDGIFFEFTTYEGERF